MPAHESNGKKLLPMNPRPEPITKSAPMTHIRSFSASGFHLATSCSTSYCDRVKIQNALSQPSRSASCTWNARILQYKLTRNVVRSQQLTEPNAALPYLAPTQA